MLRASRFISWAIFAALLAAEARSSQSAQGPRRAAGPSLEERMLADAADGRFDHFTLVQAALVAGGVADETALARHQRRFDETAAGAQARVGARGASVDRAGELLRFLHDELLHGRYARDCSRLDLALEGGDYNCVTATILYCSLAEARGLAVLPVAEPGHVLAVLSDDPAVEIQTTSREGLDAADRRPGPRRIISPVQLVAKIYYNAGTRFMDAGRFDSAAEATRIALRLDPADETARENLAAALNNESLGHCAAGRFAAAERLLEQAREVAPHFPALAANDLYLHQQWALHLCSRGEYRRAWELLEAASARRPDAEWFDRGRFAVLRAWGDALVAAGRQDEARELYAAARRVYAGRAEVAAVEEAVFAGSPAANAASGSGNRAAAADLTDRGL